MNIRLYVLHVALLFACMYYEYLFKFYYFASRLLDLRPFQQPHCTTVFHHCPYSFNNRMPSILSFCVPLCCTVPCRSIVGCTVNLVSMALRASLFGISLTVVFSVYVTPLQVLNGHMYFTFSIFKYTYKIPYLKPCEVHKSSTITIYFRTHDCISTEFAKFK